jgi:protein TonB
MEVKKSPKASLENKKFAFIELGLVAALAITFGAFEMTSKDKKDEGLKEITDELPFTHSFSTSGSISYESHI